MMIRLWHRWAASWRAEPLALRRYRVAPRQHPILFRRRLLEAIAGELRKTGLAASGRIEQYADTAL